jgi:hypothetical protein
VLLAWSSATDSPPDYVVAIAKEKEVSRSIFYCSIIVVGVCTVRYYLAITLNLYASASHNFEKMKPKIQKVVFALLCLLYFLTTSSVGAISVVGLKLALWSCLLMAIVSGLCILICWTLGEENKKRYSPTRLSFGGFDAIFFVASLIYVWQISNSPDQSSVIWLTVVALFILLITFHEWVGIYRYEIRELLTTIAKFVRS